MLHVTNVNFHHVGVSYTHRILIIDLQAGYYLDFSHAFLLETVIQNEFEGNIDHILGPMFLCQKPPPPYQK